MVQSTSPKDMKDVGWSFARQRAREIPEITTFTVAFASELVDVKEETQLSVKNETQVPSRIPKFNNLYIYSLHIYNI